MTISGVLADPLAGHAATCESLSTAQDEAPVVLHEDGAKLGSSSLTSGARGGVSNFAARMAPVAIRGVNLVVAARTAHDVHADVAVVGGRAGGLALSGPVGGASSDNGAL